MDFTISRSSLHEERRWYVSAQGGGAVPLALGSPPVGYRVTLGRTGVGLHTILFASPPGLFVQWRSPGFRVLSGAASMAGFEAVCTGYDPTIKTLTFTTFDASRNPVDLVANQWLDLEIVFAAYNPGGSAV